MPSDHTQHRERAAQCLQTSARISRGAPHGHFDSFITEVIIQASDENMCKCLWKQLNG